MKTLFVNPSTIHFSGSQLKDAIESITAEAHLLHEFFGKFKSTLFAAVQGLYEVAEKEYRCEFGRLPGTARTARGRKKRHTLVMRWYFKRRERCAISND